MAKKNKKSGKPSSSAPLKQAQTKSKKSSQKFLLLSGFMDKLLSRVCFIGIISLAFLMNFHTLTDTDIFWHLKTGQIIYETHQVPHQDIYSFTMQGKEWIDSQWLFQLLIYIFYRFSGYTGMILFGSVITALTWLLILVPGFAPKRYFSLLLLGLISLLAVSIRLKLRPEILTFFYLALEILLIDLVKRGKKCALIPLPFLLLLWVNSEGLWPIYFVVLIAFLLEELLFIPNWWLKRIFSRDSDGRKSVALLGIALACSILLAFANPYGYRGVLFPWTLFKEVAHPGSYLGQVIYEFRNPFSHLPGLDLCAYIMLLILSAFFFAILFYQRRLYPASLLLWLGFLFLSISALRNVALFAVVTFSLVSRILAEDKDIEFFPLTQLKARFLKFKPAFSLLALAGIIWLMSDVVSNRFYLRNRTFAQFGIGALETEYPIRAAQTLKKFSASINPGVILKIFSDASSSYLIWAGYPAWQVYIDPRLEVYGEEFFKNYARVIQSWDGFRQEDEKWDFDVALLSHFPEPKNLLRELYHSPDWFLIHLDGQSAVFVKNRPELASIISQVRINFQQGFQCPMPARVIPALAGRERFNLGKSLLMMEQVEFAREAFSDAVRLEPENSEYNLYLGSTLNLLGQAQEALPYLEQAAKLEPDSALVQIQLGRSLAKSGSPERAIQIFQKLLSQYPDQIYVCMDLAIVYEMVQDRDHAHRQWKRCEEISRLDPIGFKAQAYEISEALKRLEKAKQ